MTQDLQPGSVPAWAGDTPSSEIDDVWADEMWPAIWPKLVYTFDSVAARDAEISGLGPLDVAYAFVKDSKTFWRWNGSAWALAAPWVQRGSVAVGAVAAGGGTTIPVTFANDFGTAAYTAVFELNSTRLSAIPTAKSGTGFTLGVNNFTSGGSSAGTIVWAATLAP